MNKFELSEQELNIKQRIAKLKSASGSHSPSVSALKHALSDVKFKIDACFLSNPYATDLFLTWLDKEIIAPGKLRQLLEFYPAQNNQIAELLETVLNIPSSKLFIANGASEAIDAIMKNFTGSKLAVTLPTFSSYYEFVRPQQEVFYFHLNKQEEFQLNIEKYIEFIYYNKVDTAILINPNNPNGGYISKKDIETILQRLSHLQTIIVDESFIHFAYEDDSFKKISVADLIDTYPNLVVIKSMSKDFGIAGVRAGYAIMKSDWVKQLLDKGYLWNSNGFAEYFFKLCSNKDFVDAYEPLRIEHIKDTQDFISKLSTISQLKVYPSMGNFVLIELPKPFKAQDVVIAMLARFGIYLRDCSDKKGLDGQFIRVASRTKEENKQIFQAFSTIFD